MKATMIVFVFATLKKPYLTNLTSPGLTIPGGTHTLALPEAFFYQQLTRYFLELTARYFQELPKFGKKKRIKDR
jgi:hypothetical protein